MSVTEPGNTTVAVVGLLTSSVGGLLLFVGLVAHAVRLGTRAGRD